MKSSATMFIAALGAAAVGLSGCEKSTEERGESSTAYTSKSEDAEEAANLNVNGETPTDCKRGAALYHSVFTAEVQESVPQGAYVALGPDDHNVVFFTEVVGARGQTLTHRWLHNDVDLDQTSFAVVDDSSRNWSSQQVDALVPGVLHVEVRIGSCLIGRQSVQIAAATQPDPASGTGWMRPVQALETWLTRPDGRKPRKGREPLYRRDESGDTPLTAAIRNRDEVEVRKLIIAHDMKTVSNANQLSGADYKAYRRRADPLVKDRDGVSPIDLAYRTDQSAIVELLIDSATGPRIPTRRNSYSQGNGRWTDPHLLSLRQGKGPDNRFADSDTPLIRAVRLGNERAVLTLLRIDAETIHEPYEIAEQLYAFDASGRQALDVAQSEGFYGIERFLEIAMAKYEPRWALNRASFAISMDGDEPAVCRKDGFTDEAHFYFFAEVTDLQRKQIRHEWRFNGEVVQTDEFDIESQYEKTVSERRFSASDLGSWDVNVLSATGEILGSHRLHYRQLTPRIEKNRQNFTGPEACDLGSGAMFHLAEAFAPISKFQYLVDKGASLRPQSSIYKSLLKKAIETGNINLTRWFLDRGADPNAWVDGGELPLTIAAKAHDGPMSLFLIGMGADVNKQRYRGKLTALHLSTVDLDLEHARLLLENGADPNVPGDTGWTALHNATSRCAAELSVLLLEHGADSLATNKAGETPIDWAAKCRKTDLWRPELAGLAPLLVREGSHESVGEAASDETQPPAAF